MTTGRERFAIFSASLHGLVDQFFQWHDPADQSGARPLCVHHAAGQHHLHRFRFADKPGQPLGATGTRDSSDQISGWPNFAFSAARMKSHIMANSHPPPSAYPATAATTGLRQWDRRSQFTVMKSSL